MLRIMIVDDEQIIRESLSQMIDYKSLGYELVASARSSMEAYDIICDEYPDVVITDIKMPVVSGLELIERSVKTDPRINFIVLSGYGEFEYARQAMGYGVRHYLLKPTDKQELIDALIDLRDERLLEEERRQQDRLRLLRKLHSPLEQCFIMEALEDPDQISPIFRKYQSLLNLKNTGVAACVCSFVEEPYVKAFVSDVHPLFSSRSIPLVFPIIYVKNSAVLIFEAPTLCEQERLQSDLSQLSYEGQAVSFETKLIHGTDTEHLFRRLILKISRFERILLLDKDHPSREIRNNIAAPWRIDRLGADLSQAADESQTLEMLDSIFTPSLPLESARNIALSLFLKLNGNREEQSLDIACDFFRKLYSSPDSSGIRELMQVMVIQKNSHEKKTKTNTNIALLKAYVNKHLDWENLSLKWLAENYLFVSVGYLSKQFVKEEGLRFSDYLNKVRMEEAKRLITYYHYDNIKIIAKQLGFGNNPQYFSQVFKRYTGLTPSDYMEQQRS